MLFIMAIDEWVDGRFSRDMWRQTEVNSKDSWEIKICFFFLCLHIYEGYPKTCSMNCGFKAGAVVCSNSPSPNCAVKNTSTRV